jgi:hypothetical protein
VASLDTDNFCLLFYLCKNFDRTIRAALCKIRCSAHILLIETGGYTNQPKNMRLCTLCSSSEVEDEFNFVLKCDCFVDLRVKKIKNRRPSSVKLIQLLSSQNVKQLRNLCIFLKCAFKRRDLVIFS